jgi:D-serine deaminase-like pyridoxal phosphate-dependent protein
VLYELDSVLRLGLFNGGVVQHSMAMLKADLDTPALLLDMEAMEVNLGRMAAFFANKTTNLRPHFKNHKCIALAKRQLAAGAIGITCATLREAQVLVSHDIQSVLIANEIAGEAKIQHFINLARLADVIVAVDNIHTVRALAKHDTRLSVVVDVDVGLGRGGVRPGLEALSLARQAIQNGLVFRGLMGYEGRITSATACESAMARLVACRRLIEESGITVGIVTAGGTGSYAIAGQYPGITEVQAGSYIVMDADYHKICPDFDPVLTVIATVISMTEGDRIIVDAGLKTLSSDRGMPTLKGLPGARLRKLHAEHGIVDILDPSLNVQIGDRLELAVHYGDGTVNLHDRMYGVRGDSVEEVFRIER